MSYLIDTNVISELVKTNPEKKVLNWFNDIPEDGLYISVLTIGEIRKGVEKIKEQTKKEKLRIWLEHELPEWFDNRILPIDNHVAERWGRIQAHANRPIPAIDSLIAATALQFNLTLVTRNVLDFNYFSDLEIVNPWD